MTTLRNVLAVLIVALPSAAFAQQPQNALAEKVRALEEQMSKLSSTMTERLKDLDALKKANEALNEALETQSTQVLNHESRLGQCEDKLRAQSMDGLGQ